jgi:hypothetical protein
MAFWKLSFAVVIFWLFFLTNGYAQSFELFLKVEEGLCNAPYSKIIEDEFGNLFEIGSKDCGAVIRKINAFGKLSWEIRPTIRTGYLSDFVSFNLYKTFHVIDAGLPFPERSTMLEFTRNGKILYEKQIVVNTYTVRFLSDKLSNKKIILGGYNFQKYPSYFPVLEYRSLKGDTLGKFEYPLPWNAMAQKVYLNEKDNNILLFCSENGWGKITVLRVDTNGHLLDTMVYSKNYEYSSTYFDMAQKDSSYYMIVDMDDTPRRLVVGYFLIRFGSKGDSLSLTPLSKRFNSIAATNDNGLILARSSLLKLDSNLNVEWEKPFKEGVEILSVGASKGGGYYGSGRIYNKALKEYRTYVFRTNANGDIETSNNYPQYQIYPNPFHEELRFELPFGEAFNVSLYDMQGKRVVDVNCVGSTYINPDFLSQGVYWANITNQNGLSLYSQKLIKLK